MPNRKELEFFKKISPRLADVLKLENDDHFLMNYTSKIFSSFEVPKMIESYIM